MRKIARQKVRARVRRYETLVLDLYRTEVQKGEPLTSKEKKRIVKEYFTRHRECGIGYDSFIPASPYFKELEAYLGTADLLSEGILAEVDHIDNWKEALGRLICYSYCFGSLKTKLVLFGDSSTYTRKSINFICSREDINLIFVEFESKEPNKEGFEG